MPANYYTRKFASGEASSRGEKHMTKLEETIKKIVTEIKEARYEEELATNALKVDEGMAEEA